MSIISTIISFFKGNQKEVVVANRYESLEDKAMSRAEKMTNAEKADILRRHSTDTWDSKVSDGIMVHISALNITSVDVYGVPFTSVKRAVNKSMSMNQDEALRLMSMEKELLIVRKIKFAAETNYRMESSPIFGDVYAYKASKIAVERSSNEAPRIVVQLNRKDSGAVEATDIYVAASDIRTAKSYDHYDMTNPDIVQRFEDIIIKDESEYGEEVQKIEAILERLDKYKFLVEKKLLKIENGRFIFSIPTKDQLKEFRDKYMDAAVDTDEDDADEEIINPMFEDLHSSNE